MGFTRLHFHLFILHINLLFFRYQFIRKLVHSFLELKDQKLILSLQHLSILLFLIDKFFEHSNGLTLISLLFLRANVLFVRARIPSILRKLVKFLLSKAFGAIQIDLFDIVARVVREIIIHIYRIPSVRISFCRIYCFLPHYLGPSTTGLLHVSAPCWGLILIFFDVLLYKHIDLLDRPVVSNFIAPVGLFLIV